VGHKDQIINIRLCIGDPLAGALMEAPVRKWISYKFSGVRPVFLAIRDNILGPISSLS